MLSNEPDEEQSILWVQYSGDSCLGNKGTLRLYQKKKLLNDYVRFIPLNPVVFKVVGLNSLVVRQFGFRFHCNGIKQLAKDFLKACRPVCHGTLPFPPFPLHHALSAPTVHLNGYRLILLIWHLARSGHCL